MGDSLAHARCRDTKNMLSCKTSSPPPHPPLLPHLIPTARWFPFFAHTRDGNHRRTIRTPISSSTRHRAGWRAGSQPSSPTSAQQQTARTRLCHSTMHIKRRVHILTHAPAPAHTSEHACGCTQMYYNIYCPQICNAASDAMFVCIYAVHKDVASLVWLVCHLIMTERTPNPGETHPAHPSPAARVPPNSRQNVFIFFDPHLRENRLYQAWRCCVQFRFGWALRAACLPA